MNRTGKTPHRGRASSQATKTDEQGDSPCAAEKRKRLAEAGEAFASRHVELIVRLAK